CPASSIPNGSFIVDHEYGTAAARYVSSLDIWPLLIRRPRDRKEHRKGGSTPQRALHFECSIMAAHDSLYSRQPEPAAGKFSSKEGVENFGHGLGIHSGSRVRDLQSHVLSGLDVSRGGTLLKKTIVKVFL